MVIRVVLISAIAVISSSLETCPFVDCDPSYIGDLYCDLQCNNILCNFDSSSTSDSLSNFEKFKLSDCYTDCILSNCTDALLQNDKCDIACDNTYCGFDLGLCGVCASGCEKKMLENSDCDSKCNNDLCQLDNYACGYCASGCKKDDLLKPNCAVTQCKNDLCINEPSNTCFLQCSPSCPYGWQGDGICDDECYTAACEYDKGDCVCAPGCTPEIRNKNCTGVSDPCNHIDCDFKDFKCGECAFNCFYSQVGDGVCNLDCMNEDCEFDYGDCQCSEGCMMNFEGSTWRNLSANINNTNCLVPECLYNIENSPDEFIVRRMILTNLYNKDMSLIELKNYSSECTEENMRKYDNVSNEKCPIGDLCDNEDGLWCMGRSQRNFTDCLRSSNESCIVYNNYMVEFNLNKTLEKCPNGYATYTELNLLFANSTDDFKLCIQSVEYFTESNPHTLYVAPADEPEASGVGSELDPYKSLFYAFTQVYASFTRIILNEGSFYYKYDEDVVQLDRYNPFDPLNFDNGEDFINFIEVTGKSEANPSIVYWIPDFTSGSLNVLKISSSAYYMRFANIKFVGTKLLNYSCSLNGTQCFYCPYFYEIYSQIKGVYVLTSDRRVMAEDLAKNQTDKCDAFGEVELFVLGMEADFYNVQFDGFRMKFQTLIRSYNTLKLNKVDFKNIQAKSGKNVIEVSCTSECSRVDFVYNQGKIEGINEGYEITDSVETGSFLRLSTIRSVRLVDINANYSFLYSNLDSSSTSYFISVENFNGTLSFLNSTFSNIYANTLIEIDVTKLKYFDIMPDENGFSESYNQLHFTLDNITFSNIYTSESFIEYKMKSTAHNIQLSNLNFSKIFSSQSSLIKLANSGSLKKRDIIGDKLKQQGISAWANPKKVLLQNLTFENCSTSEYLIYIDKNPNLNLTNIKVTSLYDRNNYDVGEIVKNFNTSGKYLSIQPTDNFVQEITCRGAINVFECYNVSLSKVKIYNAACKGKETNTGITIADSELYLNITDLELVNITSNYYAGGALDLKNLNLSVRIDGLKLESVKNSDGSIFEINKCSNASIKNLNCKSIASAYSSPVKISEIFNFELITFTVENSSSLYGDGGFLNIIANIKSNPKISISNGQIDEVYSQGKGGFLLLDALNSKGKQSLYIDNVNLTSVISNDGVLLFITDKINFKESNISNIKIESSGGTVSMIHDFHIGGTLYLENILILNNSVTEVAGIIGDYQTEGEMLKVLNFEIYGFNDSERAFDFSGKNSKTIVSIDIIKILGNFDSESNTEGIAISSITLNLQNLVLTEMKNFIYISKNAQAIVKKADISGTSDFVAQVQNLGYLECVQCEIYNNYGTIISCSTESSIKLYSSSITNNKYSGSQVFLINIDSSGNNKNIIEKTIIQDNYSLKVDLIKFSNADVEIKDSVVSGNIIASSLYTGIFIFKSNVTINDTQFYDQYSQKFGVFIHAVENSTVVIDQSSFDSGDSGMDGGAIYIYKCEKLAIYNSRFTNNSATSSGGSIYAFLTDVYIENTEFLENNAGQGSDLFMINGTFSIINTTISKSSCNLANDCVSIYTIGSYLEFSQLSLSNSSNSVSGVYASGFTSIVISNSSFARLKGRSFGALSVRGSSKLSRLDIFDSVFEENESGNNGGAINLANMALYIKNTKIISNFAQVAGGGLYLVTPDCLNCSFEIAGSSVITKNEAGRLGGAIKWEDYKPSVSPSVKVSDNIALYGGNYASKAATLQSADRFLQESSDNASAYISDIPPGQAFNASLFISIRDTYNNIMLIDNSSTLRLDSGKSDIILQGSISFQAVNGVFNISGFTPRASPGSSRTIKAYTDGIVPKKIPNDDTIYKNYIIINITIRPCSNGEKIGENACTKCQEPRYLIEPGFNCKMCPTGGICVGGDEIWVKKGYYRTHYLSEIVYSCALADACKGNDQGWETECLDGYTGITCAVCEKGYSKSGSGKCNKCPDPAANYIILVGILVAIVFICIVLVKSSVKSAFVPKSKHSIYIKIFTNYLQLVFLTAQFNLSWPSYVINLFGIQKSAATATDSLFSIDCYFADSSSISLSDLYYFKMVFYAALPLGIFIISAVVWIGICMTREHFGAMKRELPLTMIVIFFLVYPNIVKFMFSNFACTNFDMMGTFLNDNYSVKCWNDQHSKFSVRVAVPAIIIWSIGVPTIVLIAMIKRRRYLFKEDNRIVFGFIFNGYKTSIFYWEFIIMYRKILIICVIVFIADISTAVQGLTVSLLLIFSLFIQYEVGPYNSDELNHMEVEALITATLTIYCGLYYLTEDISEAFKIVLFVIIVCGNSYFIILWFYWMLKALIDMIAKTIPSLKAILKKGDAFEDDFNKEEIVVNGSYFDNMDGKRHYTFMKSDDETQTRFNVTCLPELYVRVIAEKDEFSEDIQDLCGDEECLGENFDEGGLTERQLAESWDEEDVPGERMSRRQEMKIKEKNEFVGTSRKQTLSLDRRTTDVQYVTPRFNSTNHNTFVESFSSREPGIEDSRDGRDDRKGKTSRNLSEARPRVNVNTTRPPLKNIIDQDVSPLLEEKPLYLSEEEFVQSYLPSDIGTPGLANDKNNLDT